MKDNIISKNEDKKLNNLRSRLGLSRRDARLIINEIRQTTRIESRVNCPHCRSSFDINHPAGELFVKKQSDL
jgi:voltage-gated potassium channel